VQSSPKPIRVAFLTHEPFFPPSGGGSAEANYVVEEMTRRGHEVHVFCPKLADPKAVERQFGVRVHEFTTWEMGRYTRLRNFKYVLYPFFLERLVARDARITPFGVVFSQHAISAVAAGRLKGRLGTPVVMNFLDYLTGFMETWPVFKALKPVIGALTRFELSIPSRYDADAVCAVSDVLAEYFVRSGYPAERVEPIYFGYDSGLFRLRANPPRNAAPLVVMHGSLDVHHLGETAFVALKTVHQARPDARFRFVGHRTGALEGLLARVRAEMPKAVVETTGFVPYAEVPGRLVDADVGIVPYEESKGTRCAFVAKPVEYAALGIPVVCTPLESVKRFFGNTPLIRFSEFDGVDFGQKIVSWFSEPPERIAAWGAEASHKVETELDWRSISRKAVNRMERVARSKK
jgi:glycosyltransferase involved in cell wall biosynthesis